ncbi:serine protease HTRA2, mitochondrial-like isoform X1 [Tubulanus polymorphus]|uniref:serine protease HTRA2, mitochondrial-like isoform X1 n=1 Tax=Tubulanus polymorphus TaxID=672921 RepID=UPI003DA6693D
MHAVQCCHHKVNNNMAAPRANKFLKIFSYFPKLAGSSGERVHSSNRSNRIFQQIVRSKYERNRKSIKFAALVGAGTAAACAISHYYFDNFHDGDGNRTGFIPRVTAAEVYNTDVHDPPIPVSRRSQFNFIADTVKMVSPAVVFIDIQGRHPYSGEMHTVSNGSGFIVREDGLILTNAHVVANRKHVCVTLQDGRKFEGHVQAVDPVTDLATVKINATGMQAMKLGHSSEVRPGEWVIAMGSPFTLNNTVTAGIISTVGRGSKELGMHFRDMEYIQTDAVINFGNSGGPLVNLDGEAIGINTMKVTTGISFAIPSDYAKDFLERAEKLEHRKSPKSWFGGSSSLAPKRRYMGVTMLTLNPNIILELQNRMDIPDVTEGVLIHKVVIGSPAHRSGMRPGDILIQINGASVRSAKDVYKATAEHSEMDVTLVRGHQKIILKIKPEDMN